MALLDLVLLRPLVVVLVQYVLADVHAVADDCFGDVFGEEVGDGAAPNWVWPMARRPFGLAGSGSRRA